MYNVVAKAGTEDGAKNSIVNIYRDIDRVFEKAKEEQWSSNTVPHQVSQQQQEELNAVQRNFWNKVFNLQLLRVTVVVSVLGQTLGTGYNTIPIQLLAGIWAISDRPASSNRAGTNRTA